MKILVLISCALAVASAGWAPQHAPIGYHGPQHVPVIHNGVPVETPEVQHAKAAHLAALAEASSHSGYTSSAQHYEDDGQYHELPQAQVGHQGYSFQGIHAPVQIHHQAPVHHAAPEPLHFASKAHIQPAYETSHVLPGISHDGRPLDTPEVEAAKSHHFHAFQQALALTAPHKPDEYNYNQEQPAAHYRRRRGLYHVPLINHHGVPEEPIAVQHARASHLAAHHTPTYGYSTHQIHAPVYGHHHDYYIPKYDHHGRPLDTEEVEHAKAKHFAAYHEAAARNAVHPVAPIAHVGYAGSWAYQGAHHGVPVDTPEVQHAKAAHFAAHAAAKAHHYY